jgi:preprotein translocase subunit SecF
MNLENAPRFFWAALSVSLLMLTAGLLLLAYRASSVSVEFADAKVQFANDKIEVAEIVADTKSQIEQLQMQNQELLTVKSNLEARLRQLQSDSPTVRTQLVFVSNALHTVARALPPARFDKDLERLDRIQQTLTRQSR